MPCKILSFKAHQAALKERDKPNYDTFYAYINIIAQVNIYDDCY